MVRVGGFVIHGNSVETLGPCLDSLLAVADEVVAVESQATDGSSELVRSRGVRGLRAAWEGFGAARAAAASALGPCDYVIFLDADEWLDVKSIDRLRAWKEGEPSLPQYTVLRHDWAELPGRRFLFRTETRVRLLRRDCARWERSWIVHEAMPRLERAASGACIEHRFAREIDEVAKKQRRYAFLWAVRAFGEGRREASSAFGRRASHVLRNAVVKGALLRGGSDGWRLSAAVAEYHVAKHLYLKAIRGGAYADAVAAWRDGRFDWLFTFVRDGPPELPLLQASVDFNPLASNDTDRRMF